MLLVYMTEEHSSFLTFIASVVVIFLITVVVRSYWYVPSSVAWLLLLLSLVFVLLYVFLRIRFLVYVVLFFGVVGLTLFRYGAVDQSELLFRYREYVGNDVVVNARVVSEADVRENYARYVMELYFEDGALPLRTLVYVPPFVRYEYAEYVRVKGKLDPVESIDEEFDWKAFLAKDEIYAQLFRPQVIRSGEFKGGLVTRSLYRFKYVLLRSLARVLPEPHASLAGGLVFGGKRSLPRSVLDDFRTAGLVHIVVLSGYNITIVAVALMALLARLPLRVRLVLGAIAMILFGVMVGGGATVIRSVLMALIALLARALGREYRVHRALIAALVMMVWWSPKVLVFDVGFQLSFIATAGLIYGVPIVTPWVSWVPARFGFQEIVATTIAAQIAVLPLLMYAIGELSLVSLPVNILVLPMVPLVMATGVATAFLGVVLRPPALLFGFVTYFLLSYMFFVVNVATAIPFAAVSVPHIPFILVVVSYVFLIGYVVWVNRSTPLVEIQ